MMTRLILDITAILLGSVGGLAGFLTLRQRRQLLTAQAEDVRSTGQARIMDAAGRIVEQQAELVPQLLERIAALETRDSSRQSEVDDLYGFADAAVHWMQLALGLVQELGGQIPAPPQPPTRPVVFPRPKPPGPGEMRPLRRADDVPRE